MLQPMKIKNVSDARLALHQRMVDALVLLMVDGVGGDDDIELASEIVDTLMQVLQVEVVDFDDVRVQCSVMIG